MSMTEQEFYQLQENGAQDLFKKHKLDDPKEFALKYSGKSDLPIRALSEQIKCYQKAKKKLPTLSKHSLLYESVAIEQCSGEAAAKYKSHLLSGNLMLDLTGGLGIDDIYFSQRFKRVIHCEKNDVLSKIAEYNFARLEIHNIETIATDSLKVLKDVERVDWIYIDPARRDERSRFVSLETCVPNVVELQETLLSKSDRVCIKVSPGVDFTAVKKQLNFLKEFIVISVNNECKEILLILEKGYVEQVEVKAVMIDTRTEHIETLQKHEKTYYQKAPSTKLHHFFYEPDVAIIKSKLSAKLAHILGIAFVNASVDYMTSDKRVENFPGRAFEIKEVIPYQRKTLKNFLKVNKIFKANVARRDFPDSPEYIRKIFKLKDGGKDYLFFTKNSFNDLICIHCERID